MCKGYDVARDAGKAQWGKRLVPKVVCPNCWHDFAPEEVLFVAKHQDLMGDLVAGANEYTRFIPSRFTIKGEAIDPRGLPTAETACPRCHLQIPGALLEVPPLFVSIVGSPASGKSYFLAAMTWELRRLLPQGRLTFSDADPVANSALQEYEQTLFMNPNPDRPTEIRKTQNDDPRLHRTVLLEGSPMRFPVPFQFSLWPTPEHPRFAEASRIGRAVVLYDNAGEDFLPGAEGATSAVTQHLARSHALFFLFDPTQDPRFREYCRDDDPQIAHGLRPGANKPPSVRQEMLLREVAVRIRRYLGIAQDKRLRKPLIVIVPKSDVWAEAAGLSLDREPYAEAGNGRGLRIDARRVEKVSTALHHLFAKLCPDLVATANGLSEIVRYVPVSSLGRSPSVVRRSKETFYGIRPAEISPHWVTVPLTYCLCRFAAGLIPEAK